jgi:hypothetical protein
MNVRQAVGSCRAIEMGEMEDDAGVLSPEAEDGLKGLGGKAAEERALLNSKPVYVLP